MVRFGFTALETATVNNLLFSKSTRFTNRVYLNDTELQNCFRLRGSEGLVDTRLREGVPLGWDAGGGRAPTGAGELGLSGEQVVNGRPPHRCTLPHNYRPWTTLRKDQMMH